MKIGLACKILSDNVGLGLEKIHEKVPNFYPFFKLS